MSYNKTNSHSITKINGGHVTHSFQHRRVFTLSEVKLLLGNRLVVGFSGYTKAPPQSSYHQQARRWVESFLGHCHRLFPNHLAVVYGSSASGIDLITEEICLSLEIPLVGITCPEFFEWVPDEGHRPPIYPEKSRESYSQRYIDLLHLLVVTGGRDHTLKKDTRLALEKGKAIWIQNLAREIPHLDEGELSNAADLIEKVLALPRENQKKRKREMNHLASSIDLSSELISLLLNANPREMRIMTQERHESIFAGLEALRRNPGDRELIQRVVGEIANELWERAYRKAHSILKDRELSEEVAQEVFVIVFRKIESFRGQIWVELVGWILKITYREAIKHIKTLKDNRKKLAFDDALHDVFARANQVEVRLVDPLDYGELMEAVQNCLPPPNQAKLKPVESQILSLSVAGLEHGEIAEILDLSSTGNARVLLCRARKKLDKCLRKKGYNIHKIFC